MKLLLKSYAIESGLTKHKVRKDLVKLFEITDQNFRDWWRTGRPVITIECQDDFTITALWKGKQVEIGRRAS